MSGFNLGLWLLGALVIAGVLVYNAWTLRRSAPRTVRTADGSERVEPSEASGQDAWQAPDARSEPSLDEEAPLTGSADAAVALRESLAPLDPLIDAIVPLALEHAVSGDAVLAALPRSRRVGSKAFAVEARNVVSGDWETPRAGQRYGALQAGVQLASRSGALNNIEFSEFVATTQAFADAVGAAPDFPDMREEVARARELDQFASEHDAQLGFTVRARRAAWSPGYVMQQAGQQGFVPGALPGRLVLPALEARQAPLLSLQMDTQAALAEDPEQSALRDFSLLLEVTHVPRQAQPYQRLRQAAEQLATSMEGQLSDDAGNPLGSDALDRIGADLETLYDALEARDLAAGSPLARRLFA